MILIGDKKPTSVYRINKMTCKMCCMVKTNKNTDLGRQYSSAFLLLKTRTSVIKKRILIIKTEVEFRNAKYLLTGLAKFSL